MRIRPWSTYWHSVPRNCGDVTCQSYDEFGAWERWLDQRLRQDDIDDYDAIMDSLDTPFKARLYALMCDLADQTTEATGGRLRLASEEDAEMTAYTATTTYTAYCACDCCHAGHAANRDPKGRWGPCCECGGPMTPGGPIKITDWHDDDQWPDVEYIPRDDTPEAWEEHARWLKSVGLARRA